MSSKLKFSLFGALAVAALVIVIAIVSGEQQDTGETPGNGQHSNNAGKTPSESDDGQNGEEEQLTDSTVDTETSFNLVFGGPNWRWKLAMEFEAFECSPLLERITGYAAEANLEKIVADSEIYETGLYSDSVSEARRDELLRSAGAFEYLINFRSFLTDEEGLTGGETEDLEPHLNRYQECVLALSFENIGARTNSLERLQTRP